jgi:hypothetical protein
MTWIFRAVAQPEFLDQWAKWARFLLVGQKFLAQQSTDSVEKTQKNEMRFF